MSDQLQSSHFQVLFESALQDYQRQTGNTLTNHPLAEKLQNCDSVESVTAVLQEQTRVFSQFRGENGRVMKPLKRVVSVLYTLCSSTTLGAAVGLVRNNALMGVQYSIYLMLYPAAISALQSHICGLCRPSRSMV
jgi:hypothetical protein